MYIKRFLVFFIIIFFSLVNNSWTQELPCLHLKVNLDLSSFFKVKGTLFTYLYPGKNYKFLFQDIKLKKIKLNKRYLKSKNLKKLSVKKKSYLYIEFQKYINYEIFPVNVFTNFFPYPEKCYTYQIKLRIPRRRKIFVLIPSEEIKILRKKYYKTYIFKTSKPVHKSYLIITKNRPKVLTFNYKNLKFYFYWFCNDLSGIQIKTFWKKLEKNLKILEFLGENEASFKKIYIFLDDSFKNNLYFPNTILVNTCILNNPQTFLRFLAEEKLKNIFQEDENNWLIKGISLYFTEYKLSSNKKFFRKKLLIFNNDDTKAFFYIFEIIQHIGEEEFLKAFRNFCKTYVLKHKSSSYFLKFLRKFYSSLKDFPDFSQYTKISLKAQVISIKSGSSKSSVKLFLKNNINRPLKLSLKIEGNDTFYPYEITLYNATQILDINFDKKIRAIYIDPDYLFWRELSSEEQPFIFKYLFINPGVIVYSFKDLPVYRKWINLFKDLGYTEVFFQPLDLTKIQKNIIYLGTPPFPWIFNYPEKGFYFKIIPNPYHTNAFIGFFRSSSIKESEEAFKLWPDLLDYFEIVIKSGDIVLKNSGKTLNGIYIPVGKNYYISDYENFLTLEKLTEQLIGAQVVLVGENKNESSLYSNFYQRFLDNILRINSNFIICLDLDPKIQEFIDKYLKGIIKFDDILQNLNSKYLDIKVDTLREILRWAKENKIKVKAIGIDSQLLNAVLEKGILKLSESEIKKLPEMDLYNSPYKEYLFKKFQDDFLYNKKFCFENFYQAQVLKKEGLAENISKLLKEFRNTQIIVFTNAEKVQKPWGIVPSLKRRKITNIKTIILDFSTQFNTKLSDYLISGVKPH